MELSPDEKRRYYVMGWWYCDAPPVTPEFWTTESWIAHIDHTGGWSKPPNADQQTLTATQQAEHWALWHKAKASVPRTN